MPLVVPGEDHNRGMAMSFQTNVERIKNQPPPPLWAWVALVYWGALVYRLVIEVWP
jgi:hypothetical protein